MRTDARSAKIVVIRRTAAKADNKVITIKGNKRYS